MEHTAQSAPLFNSVQNKLQQEISVLQEAMDKIDRFSRDPGDQWAYPLYQRIIARRRRLLQSLDA